MEVPLAVFKLAFVIILPTILLTKICARALADWTTVGRMIFSMFLVLCWYLLGLSIISSFDRYAPIDPNLVFLSAASMLILSLGFLMNRLGRKELRSVSLTTRSRSFSNDLFLEATPLLAYVVLLLPFLTIPTVIGSDASHYASIASRFLVTGKIQPLYSYSPNVFDADAVNWAIDRHPLVILHTTFWMWIFGPNTESLVVSYSAIGLLLVFFSSMILRRMSGFDWPETVALLLLLSPSLLLSTVISWPLGGQELLGLTFTLAGFYCLLEGSRTKWLYIVAGAALGIGFGMWEIIALPFLVATPLILVSRFKLRDLALSFLTVAVVFILYLNKAYFRLFLFFPLFALLSIVLIQFATQKRLILFFSALLLTVSSILLRDYVFLLWAMNAGSRVISKEIFVPYFLSQLSGYTFSPPSGYSSSLIDRIFTWFAETIQRSALGYLGIPFVLFASFVNRISRAAALALSLHVLIIGLWVPAFVTGGPAVYRFVLVPGHLLNLLAVAGLLSIVRFFRKGGRTGVRIRFGKGNIRVVAGARSVLVIVLLSVLLISTANMASYQTALSTHSSYTEHLRAYDTTARWLSSNVGQSETIFSYTPRQWSYYANRAVVYPNATDPKSLLTEMIDQRARFVIFDFDSLYYQTFQRLYYDMLRSGWFEPVYEYGGNFRVVVLERTIDHVPETSVPP